LLGGEPLSPLARDSGDSGSRERPRQYAGPAFRDGGRLITWSMRSGRNEYHRAVIRLSVLAAR